MSDHDLSPLGELPPLPFPDPTAALRASHDRLLKALEVLDVLDGHEVVAVSGSRCSHCDAWEEARAAIAEARKIG